MSLGDDALSRARLAFEQGSALLDAGQPEAAAHAFERGLVDAPGRPSLLANLALARLGLGEHAVAEQAARAALAADSDNVSAALTLAVCLQWRGAFAEALALCDRLLQRDAGLAAAWCSRGHALHGLAREEEALAAYGRALALDARLTEAWAGMADALAFLAQWDDGLAAVERALDLDPDQVGGWINRAYLLERLGRRDEALQAAQRACRLAPQNPRALLNCAKLLADERRFDEARQYLADVDGVVPDHPEVVWQRALIDLAHGDFVHGWAGYEARWRMPASNPAFDRGLPRLPGLGAARGSTVLVWAEQGLGDTLQFQRFLPALRAAGARVVFEVQAPLLALLSAQPDRASACIARGEALPHPCDFQFPLMSLPALLGEAAEPLRRAKGPTLRAPAPSMMQRLAQLGRPRARRLRVGLACSGNPGHPNDALRSIALERLLPLQAHADLVLIQPELRSADRATAQAAGLAWPAEGEGDFTATARLLGEVDLVLSVDTSLAHLAGALGLPTWLLLPHAVDWRWGLSGTHSDWYPTLRLFRQGADADWTPVIEAVGAALQTGPLTPA